MTCQHYGILSLCNYEVWQDVKGFNGVYQVSTFGRVRNHKTMRILKPALTHGYLSLHLYKNGVPYECYIHALVLKTFLPNPHHLSEINHIDGDKQNNHLYNLEYCTHTYDINYGDRTVKARLKVGHSVILSGHSLQHKFNSELDACRWLIRHHYSHAKNAHNLLHFVLRCGLYPQKHPSILGFSVHFA